MAKSKQYKMKKYSKKNKLFGGGPPKRPWKPLLGVIGVVLLVFLGVSSYPAVSDYFSGKTKPSPLPELEQPEGETPSVSVPETSTQEELIPEVARPTSVKGVTLPYAVAVDETALESYLSALPAEVNTLYFEGKDALGVIYYNTKNKQAEEWEATIENPVDLGKLVKTLEDKGYQLVVKMSVFSDRLTARANPSEHAIMHSSGVIWIDNTIDRGGKPWVTPYSDKARQHQTDLIKELSDQGVAMIFLDHVMFPYDPTNSAVLGDTKGLSRQEILNQFLEEATAAAGTTPIALAVNYQQAQLSDEENEKFFGGNPLNLSAKEIALVVGDTVALGESGMEETIKTLLNGRNPIVMLPTNDIKDVPKTGTENYVLQPIA